MPITSPHALTAILAAFACSGAPPSGVPAAPGVDAGPRFSHHLIDADLPVDSGGVGDYGQTALVDLDRDGIPDFVIGRKDAPGRPGLLYWYRRQSADRWERRVLGRESPSDVGAAALDVDGDGWPDIVTGGVWYRNPRAPREREFERKVFDRDLRWVHDVLAADVDGDGRQDIVTLFGPEGDRKAEDGLRWYRIPADPSGPWEKHVIGPGVHGAITPGGALDVDGDGDTDIVRADTWFENLDGKGLRWAAHKDIPFGRAGPFGVCVRCQAVDMDGDGRKELVMSDADIADSKVAILRNADGKGGRWERRDLPMSFTHGSLHALAVADFDGDGRLDVVSCEQEELLPPGRKDPRFVLWRNLGGGEFQERVLLDARLGGHELQVGDVNGDGRPDVLSKAWGPLPWNGAGGKMHVDCLESVKP